MVPRTITKRGGPWINYEGEQSVWHSLSVFLRAKLSSSLPLRHKILGSLLEGQRFLRAQIRQKLWKKSIYIFIVVAGSSRHFMCAGRVYILGCQSTIGVVNRRGWPSFDTPTHHLLYFIGACFVVSALIQGSIPTFLEVSVAADCVQWSLCCSWLCSIYLSWLLRCVVLCFVIAPELELFLWSHGLDNDFMWTRGHTVKSSEFVLELDN
jgi:hypothetical protein